MCNKKFKLIATAVGLVAVLVVGLAMPGVTQQIEMPTRGQIVKGLNQLIATLTASEGDILDVENAQFISYPVFIYTDDRTPPLTSSMTIAHIPFHPSSRSVQLLFDWLVKDEPFGDYLRLGAFYVREDLVGCSGYDRLTAGIYQLKATKDLRVIAVNSEGDELFIGHLKKQAPSLTTLADCPWCIVGGGIFLILCLVPGEQLCITETTCITYPGSDKPVCTEKKKCYGC